MNQKKNRQIFQENIRISR